MADDCNLFERIMELGIGISIARQMPDMLSQCMPKAQTPIQTNPPKPQVAETAFYLVINNVQAGPFRQDDIQLLIKNININLN